MATALILTSTFIVLLVSSVLYFCVSSTRGWSRVAAIGYLLVLYSINIGMVWLR